MVAGVHDTHQQANNLGEEGDCFRGVLGKEVMKIWRNGDENVRGLARKTCGLKSVLAGP